MSEVLTKLVIDASTGVETTVPLTDEEILKHNEQTAAAVAFREAQEAAAAAKAAAKASAAAKLAALGLTTEEIAAIQ